MVKEVYEKAGILKPVSPRSTPYFLDQPHKEEIATRPLQILLGRDRLTTANIYLDLSPEDAIRGFLNKWWG